jgi:hypothetical protein
MSRIEALDRRHALKYCYSYLYGSPPEFVWEELDLINAFMATLEMPYNSRSSVKTFLLRICQNPKVDCKKKVERRLIVKEDSQEAKIIFHNLEHNISVSMTTFMLIDIHLMNNIWRRMISSLAATRAK